VAGIEDLISALSNRLGGTLGGASPFQGAANRLGALSPFQLGGALGGGSPFKGGLAADSPFKGMGFNVQSPFEGRGFNVQSPFRGNLASGSPFGPQPLGGPVFNPWKPTPPPDSGQPGSGANGGQPGGPSTGLEASVARWADQAQQTFGDLGPDVPDVMLAIMTNESHGSPTAYNASGDAWGLFQQVGLGSNDPNVQFQAARKLAQEKLASIARSYAANGLNPDTRTRALDLALAWAGHFDYDTGRANPSSRDIGSGQSAAELSAVFLKNYDAIKNGRASQTGGNSGHGGMPGWNNSITPGVNGTIMQEFGPTDYSAQHPDTYAYGNAYGLAGSQHPGVDWAVDYGTRTTTPVSGTVTIVGNDHGSGYFYTNTMGPSNPDTSGEFAIQLDNGDILILGHMSNISVRVGQRLNAGDFIGLSGGSDGAHIHVEYRRKDPSTGSGYRIVDPRQYIR
jgi:murein DD-endopeptidase MepM/ murein hydrolase activator NlpD